MGHAKVIFDLMKIRMANSTVGDLDQNIFWARVSVKIFRARDDRDEIIRMRKRERLKPYLRV